MPTDHYLLSDLLYRSRALTDDAGDIVEAYDTDAYGNTLAYSAAGTSGNWWADDATTTVNPVNQFIFTGRRYDSETKIYFYRARYYAPERGRFIGRDPLEYVDGMSMYEYVGGRATSSVDAEGTASAFVADISVKLTVTRWHPGGPVTEESTPEIQFAFVTSPKPEQPTGGCRDTVTLTSSTELLLEARFPRVKLKFDFTYNILAASDNVCGCDQEAMLVGRFDFINLEDITVDRKDANGQYNKIASHDRHSYRQIFENQLFANAINVRRCDGGNDIARVRQPIEVRTVRNTFRIRMLVESITYHWALWCGDLVA